MKKDNPVHGSNDVFVKMIYITWIVMAIFFLFLCCTRGRGFEADEPPPPYDGFTPGPGSGPQYPPKPEAPRGRYNNFLTGFFTGGALGHLLSYLRGNTNREGGLGRNYRPVRTSSVFGSSSRRESPPRETSQPESSSVRTSTGYGGTRRR
jgi:hypothetical protein